MKTKIYIYNIIKILLCFFILYLSALAFYTLIIKLEISSYISVLFNIDKTEPTPILITGIFILLFLLGISFLFTSKKSFSSFLGWFLLFFAFIPLPDILQFLKICSSIQNNDWHYLFIIDFDIIKNLYLLADFPKDLLLLIVILYGMVRIEKFQVNKKEIIFITICFFAFVSMLFLSSLASILLFIGSFMLLYKTQGLLASLNQTYDKKYKKYIFYTLLFILIGKSIYRALLIINTYPI